MLAVNKEHEEDVSVERYAQAFTTVVFTIVVVILFWIFLSYWSLADREDYAGA